MLIIASDSSDVQPGIVDSLVSTSGERYDFVINANQSGGEGSFKYYVIAYRLGKISYNFLTFSFLQIIFKVFIIIVVYMNVFFFFYLIKYFTKLEVFDG